MKKGVYLVIAVVVACIIVLSGCGNSSVIYDSTDLFVGEYICIDDEIRSELTITKTSDKYRVCIELYDYSTIEAVGNVINGTMTYSGVDEYSNIIYGNIDEYGDNYPIRVEIKSEGLFEELEYERI